MARQLLRELRKLGVNLEHSKEYTTTPSAVHTASFSMNKERVRAPDIKCAIDRFKKRQANIIVTLLDGAIHLTAKSPEHNQLLKNELDNSRTQEALEKVVQAIERTGGKIKRCWWGAQPLKTGAKPWTIIVQGSRAGKLKGVRAALKGTGFRVAVKRTQRNKIVYLTPSKSAHISLLTETIPNPLVQR